MPVCVCVGGGGGGAHSLCDASLPSTTEARGILCNSITRPWTTDYAYPAVPPLSSLNNSRALRKRPLISSPNQPQTATRSEEDPALMPAQGVMVARLRLFPLPDVAIPDYPAVPDPTNPGHASLPVVLLA